MPSPENTNPGSPDATFTDPLGGETKEPMTDEEFADEFKSALDADPDTDSTTDAVFVAPERTKMDNLKDVARYPQRILYTDVHKAQEEAKKEDIRRTSDNIADIYTDAHRKHEESDPNLIHDKDQAHAEAFREQETRDDKLVHDKDIAHAQAHDVNERIREYQDPNRVKDVDDAREQAELENISRAQKAVFDAQTKYDAAQQAHRQDVDAAQVNTAPKTIVDIDKAHTAAIREEERREFGYKDYRNKKQAVAAGDKVFDEANKENTIQTARLTQEALDKAKAQSDRANESIKYPNRVVDSDEAHRQAFIADNEAAEMANLSRTYEARRAAIESGTVNGKMKQQMLDSLKDQEQASYTKVRETYKQNLDLEMKNVDKLIIAASDGKEASDTLLATDADSDARAVLRRRVLGISDDQQPREYKQFGGVLRSKKYRGPRLEERSFEIPGMPNGRLVEIVNPATGDLVRQTIIVGSEKGIKTQLKAQRLSDLGRGKRSSGSNVVSGYASELATGGSWDQQLGRPKPKVPWFMRWLNIGQ